MPTFAPGDRVTAINTDHSKPIYSRPTDTLNMFKLPEGLLQKNTIYHVASVVQLNDGSQGLYITGLRVLANNREITWHSSRFRKLSKISHKSTTSNKQKQPTPA